jgi:hypothetical protein
MLPNWFFYIVLFVSVLNAITAVTTGNLSATFGWLAATGWLGLLIEERNG